VIHYLSCAEKNFTFDAKEYGTTSVGIFQNDMPFEALTRRNLHTYSYFPVSSVSCISSCWDTCQKIVLAALKVWRFCDNSTFETDRKGVRC
jgi:hypothetical protein